MGKPKPKRKQHFQPRFKGDTFAKQRGIELRIAAIEAKLDEPKFRLYREAKETDWTAWWYSGLVAKAKEVESNNGKKVSVGASRETTATAKPTKAKRHVGNVPRQKSRSRERDDGRRNRISKRSHRRV